MTTTSKVKYHRIKFQPSGRVVELEDGGSIIKAARMAGIHINASCGGTGVCGKCRIILEEGTVQGGKSEKISAAEYKSGYRQACRSTVASSITVRIPAETELDARQLAISMPISRRARMHSYDIETLKEEGIFFPPIEKLTMELPKPSGRDNMADAARIIQGLNNQYDERGIVIGLPVLRKFRKALRENDFLVTVTLARPVNRKSKTMMVNIQPGNWNLRNYGLAFDIGTTTVQGQLVDLHTGNVLAEAADYNAQLSYGEDVITRIIHAEKPAGLEQMQELVSSTINNIINRLLQSASPPQGNDKGRIQRDEINSITLAGNTTMTHLLLKLEPHNIRRAPYVPVSTFFPPIRAQDLNIQLSEHAVALAYPAISSYVGGDIVAGIMGSGLYRTRALTLYIDIGTNAEIVVGNSEWLVCAACSAGPAFEGGGITNGVRASKGAIEDFSLNPITFEPMNITIGNKAPIGICGSGLLLIVATLFEHGVIDRSGKFNRSLDSPRIREGNSGYEYVLVWEKESGTDSDIVLNEVDIENFIRAKAAIYAGIKTLVEEVGLQTTDLNQIILAGAFGSFIDLDSAMTVGLLPEVDPDRIIYVGNGSLMGARMSEMSNHIRQDVVEVVRKMTSFELSEVASFKDKYVASLFLPHTDSDLFPNVRKRLSFLQGKTESNTQKTKTKIKKET